MEKVITRNEEFDIKTVNRRQKATNIYHAMKKRYQANQKQTYKQLNPTANHTMIAKIANKRNRIEIPQKRNKNYQYKKKDTTRTNNHKNLEQTTKLVQPHNQNKLREAN